MSAQIWEDPGNRDGNKGYTGGPIARTFYVFYEPDLAAATVLVATESGVTFQGRERKNIAWRSFGAPHAWVFTVTYGAAAGAGLSPDKLSFRVTGQQTHINQSFETFAKIAVGANQFTGTNLETDGTVAAEVTPDGVPTLDLPDYVGQTLVVTGGTGFAPGYYTITGTLGSHWVLDRAPAAVGTGGGAWYLPAAAPDMKGAIGQDKDSIQGCDTTIPGGEFSLIGNPLTSFSLADYRTLKSYVGKVSDRAWKGFEAGTLMYLGADPTGSEGTVLNDQPTSWWALAHHFRDEEHQTNVRLGDILLPFVPAFSYVHCTYGPDAVTVLGATVRTSLVMKPKYAYVERVHRGFFNPELLGIP